MRDVNVKRFSIVTALGVMTGFAIILGLLACTHSIPIPKVPVHFVRYVPFVEDVTIPDLITANIPFDVTARLSAELSPDILRGNDVRKYEPFLVYILPNGIGVVEIRLSVNLADISNTDALAEEVTVQIQPLTAGEYVFRIETADSREWGGMELIISDSDKNDVPHNSQHLKILEIPFTVLPPDDGGEGA